MTTFHNDAAATCRSALEYCDNMLCRYHTWQREHPESTPCDVEPLLVLRAQARRLLATIRAGEPIPPGAFSRMSETLAGFDLASLQYRSNNLGGGGIIRSPGADRRFGVR